MALRNRAPAWFWIVAILITLWALVGVWAYSIDATMTPASAKAQGYGAYDLKLLASRPGWYLWLYAVAIFAALFGGIALLLRSAFAPLLFTVSLVCVVLQFGYLFAVTDMIAVKGFLAAAGFPIVVALIGALELWFAGVAQRRGWIA